MYENRHILIFPYYVDILIDHLCAGRPLNGHHDVPETFRRIVLDDERQRKEKEDEKREEGEKKKKKGSRKRRRRDLGNNEITSYYLT